MITSRQAAKPAAVNDDNRSAIRSLYLESLQLVERLHRRLLDVIKDEFERKGRSDINAIQALLLFNIGNAELTAGELRSRGYYLGSNVSYNLKKLVDLGFINHQRSRVDRRSVRVSLTDKGREIADRRGRPLRAPRRLDRAGGRHQCRGVPQHEPGAAAPRPVLERHHRLSHVSVAYRPRGTARRGSKAGAGVVAPAFDISTFGRSSGCQWQTRDVRGPTTAIFGWPRTGGERAVPVSWVRCAVVTASLAPRALARSLADG